MFAVLSAIRPLSTRMHLLLEFWWLWSLTRRFEEAAQSSSPPSSSTEKASLHAVKLTHSGALGAGSWVPPGICQDKKSTLGMHLTQLQSEDPKSDHLDDWPRVLGKVSGCGRGECRIAFTPETKVNLSMLSLGVFFIGLSEKYALHIGQLRCVFIASCGSENARTFTWNPVFNDLMT